MLIGVVSDNHGLIDPALPDVLCGVEEIWHAGDLVTPDILVALALIAPVQAVRGNNDVTSQLRALPDESTFVRAGVRVLIRHIVGSPANVDREARASIVRAKPALVIMGHSHKPLAEEADRIVYLNPGSCGPRRFSLPRSAARLQLEAGNACFKVIDLDSRAVILEHTFRLSS